MYKDNKELQDKPREEDEMISNILTLTNSYMMNRIEFKKKVFKKLLKWKKVIKMENKTNIITIEKELTTKDYTDYVFNILKETGRNMLQNINIGVSANVKGVNLNFGEAKEPNNDTNFASFKLRLDDVDLDIVVKGKR
jgi:hypothetical protein